MRNLDPRLLLHADYILNKTGLVRLKNPQDDYREEIRKFIEDYRLTLRTHGIEYALHTTNESPDRVLQQFLSRR